MELRPDDLTCRCADSDFQRGPLPAEAPGLPGQRRGLQALETGLAMKARWFNITVTGATGSGRTSTIMELLGKRARSEAPGQDVCIHQNFTSPYKPRVVYLPAGDGNRFNRRIDELLTLLDKEIPQLLQRPSVKARIQELGSTYDQKEQELSEQAEAFAAEQKIAVQSTPQGVTLIPLLEDRPMKEEEFLALPDADREAIENRRRQVLERMAEINPKILAVEKEKRDAVDEHIAQSVRAIVAGHLAALRQSFGENAALDVFVKELEEELVEKRFLFLADAGGPMPFGGAQLHVMRQQFSRQCRLNVVVDRVGQTCAPVVFENNPTFNNLIGGVDFIEEQGVLKADFTQIRAGSLLQASGGYLVLQATDLFQQPIAYWAMKRAMRAGEVKLRDQFTEMGFRAGIHLEPDPVRFQTKVILVGDEALIQLIQAYDDEFARLFKITADFSRTLPRTPEVMNQFVAYVGYRAQKEQLLPLANGGIARLIEEASRQVAHQHRLNAQFGDLMDTLIEADHVARRNGHAEIARDDVVVAVRDKRYRHSKIEEIVRREISEGTILLDVAGAKVGQVNGLAVYQAGRMPFGVPTRITAQAYAGPSGLINIEREADLSGKIYNKAVLILNGYLGRLFARKEPLALSVSVSFEQSYGLIEGDSATCAEFFCIVSAISGVPLKQQIAVTGSMNQHGEVQPIGGVNEKITGFYLFAKEHGFPEGSGVLIPATNTVNLMLDEEVIEAVRAGRFHIHACARIEEGLELMTATPAGALLPDGSYPSGTVYSAAMAKLTEFAESAREDGAVARRRKAPAARGAAAGTKSRPKPNSR
ncbi:MAG: AAA family ATPase [Candidatus Lambdaproteobacteria bacterium]|nr:AAA family ATPase [Candidatus Lambdaproteobacteria bacterium]